MSPFEERSVARCSSARRARHPPIDGVHAVSYYDFAQVYDVSSFVSRHPGGADQILLGAGRDVTQLFESYHSSETPNRLVRSLLYTRVKACSTIQKHLAILFFNQHYM